MFLDVEFFNSVQNSSKVRKCQEKCLRLSKNENWKILTRFATLYFFFPSHDPAVPQNVESVEYAVVKETYCVEAYQSVALKPNTCLLVFAQVVFA